MVARNSNPRTNPSADTAVVIINGKYKPQILYKYKQVVHHTMDGIDVLALAEVLLQATHCARFHRVPSLLHCLTDLETWHYFTFCTSTGITWYHKVVHNSNLSSSDIQTHLEFLVTVVD